MIVGSDLHGNLPPLPRCDLLCLVGDIFPWQEHGLRYQKKWQEEVFLPWLHYQPAGEKIIVAGNHDFLWQREKPQGNFHYLEDTGVSLSGWNFWGTPWTPPQPGEAPRWAFRLPEEELEKKFHKVPDDTDVLLSHGPPWGLLDWTGGRHAGSEAMLRCLDRVGPAAFFCGHIHESSGPLVYRGSLLLNTTMRDRERRAHSMWRVRLRPDRITWKHNTKK